MRRIQPFVLLMIGLSFSAQVNAQTKAKITVTFFTPEHVDPNRVVRFNDTEMQSISGADLAVPTSQLEAKRGVEFHGAIVDPKLNAAYDITKLDFDFFYNGVEGDVLVQSFGGPGNVTNQYNAWNVSGGLVDMTTHRWHYTFSGGGEGQAPINDYFDPGSLNMFHQSFATVTVSGDTDTDLQNFITANPAGSIGVAPTTSGTTRQLPTPTPEFGSAFSLAGLLAAGGAGVFLRARRSRRAA